MADKAIPDISLGGAEQNMSREELAAVTKAVATLSPEDRDLLARCRENALRTVAEKFEIHKMCAATFEEYQKACQ